MPELCETETFQSEPAFQNYHNRLQPMKEGVGDCEAGKKKSGHFKGEVRGRVWTNQNACNMQ